MSDQQSQQAYDAWNSDPTRPPGDGTLATVAGISVFAVCLAGAILAQAAWLQYAHNGNWVLWLHTVVHQHIPGVGWLLSHAGHWRWYRLATSPTPIYIGVFTGMVLSPLTSWYAYERSRQPGLQHIRGRERVEGIAAVDALQAEMGDEQEWGGEGIRLIRTPDDDEITISQDRETRHLMVLGSVGGGKTTVLRNLIDATRERGDRLLVFDNKSDFSLTHEDGDDVAIFAPWSAAQYAWDVDADIQSAADAREFSSALIPVSDRDPLWGSAARAIVTALIIRVQDEAQKARKRWRLINVVKLLQEGDKTIQASVRDYTPEMESLVKDLQSKTTVSILINVRAFVRPLLDLADAWDRCQSKKRISIRRWLENEDGDDGIKTLVLQGSGAYSTVQESMTQAIMSSVIRRVTSHEITDVTPNDRRVWVFADEMPQFGQIDGFSRLLEVGRSKGIRVAIGVQDLAQLRAIYDDDAVESWSSLVGTTVVCRTQGTETPRKLSQMIGQRRVKIYQPGGSRGGQQQPDQSLSAQYQETDIPVMCADEFGRVLGTHSSGVRVGVHTGGDYFFVIDAVHLHEGQKTPVRKFAPAKWTLPGWRSFEPAEPPSSDDDADEDQQSAETEVE